MSNLPDKVIDRVRLISHMLPDRQRSVEHHVLYLLVAAMGADHCHYDREHSFGTARIGVFRVADPADKVLYAVGNWQCIDVNASFFLSPLFCHYTQRSYGIAYVGPDQQSCLAGLATLLSLDRVGQIGGARNAQNAVDVLCSGLSAQRNHETSTAGLCIRNY